MGRVLAEITAQCPVPYIKALTNDPVIDVVGNLVDAGRGTAAVVFSEADGTLAGIFTERDYLKVQLSKNGNGNDETIKLVSNVGTWMTPVDVIVSATADTTAEEALATMSEKRIRHLVITAADVEVEGVEGLKKANNLLGVVAVNQIVGLLQKDDVKEVTALDFTTLSPELSDGASSFGYQETVTLLRNRQMDRANQAGLEAGAEDVKRTALLTFVLAGVVLSLQGTFLSDHWQVAMWSVFGLGYAGIVLEEVFGFNKAGIGLLMSGLLWVIYSDFDSAVIGASGASPEVLSQLGGKLAEVSDICFFILAASTIVEVMDAHQGFRVVTKLLETDNKKQLFINISVLTFFLSAILNNLTVTIVMVSLLRKLVPDKEERKLFGALVVVAANAGGVWTPIGDVTTTMLWINENLSTLPIVTNLFLPSLASIVVSTALLLPQVQEDEECDVEICAANAITASFAAEDELAPRGNIVFATGILCLLFVPVFNELTGLPPYLGMLGGLGVMWVLTDVIHAGESRDTLKVPSALGKLDTSGILFFFGVLLSVGALESSGLLKDLAQTLSDAIGNVNVIAAVIGVASAVIDNVPLVAATMGMYSLEQYPTDDTLWQLIAYCAGTGGSILVIGSASGVALMGLEKVEFLWYAKKVSLACFVGYLAGIAVFLGQAEVVKQFAS